MIVSLNQESDWGMVLQQDRGLVELDFGGQGCEARLRGRGHTVWVYFWTRGFVLGSREISVLLCSG